MARKTQLVTKKGTVLKLKPEAPPFKRRTRKTRYA